MVKGLRNPNNWYPNKKGIPNLLIGIKFWLIKFFKTRNFPSTKKGAQKGMVKNIDSYCWNNWAFKRAYLKSFKVLELGKELTILRYRDI